MRTRRRPILLSFFLLASILVCYRRKDANRDVVSSFVGLLWRKWKLMDGGGCGRGGKRGEEREEWNGLEWNGMQGRKESEKLYEWALPRLTM